MDKQRSKDAVKTVVSLKQFISKFETVAQSPDSGYPFSRPAVVLEAKDFLENLKLIQTALDVLLDYTTDALLEEPE
jgi:hypothetical protein